MKKRAVSILLCIFLCVCAHAKIVSVSVQKNDGASCAIVCLKNEVVAAGFNPAFKIYQLVYGMKFVGSSVDSSLLIFAGDIFSYDTETKEVVYTVGKTGEQIVYSCIEKKLTSQIAEQKYVSCGSGVCNCKFVTNTVSDSFQANDNTPLIAVDTILPTPIVVEALDTLVAEPIDSGCALLRAFQKDSTVVLFNIKQKIKELKQAHVKAKTRKNWRQVLPVLAKSYKYPDACNKLARSLVCENLARLKLFKVNQKEAGIRYSISSKKFDGDEIRIVVLKKKYLIEFVCDGKTKSFIGNTELVVAANELKNKNDALKQNDTEPDK